MGTDFKTFLATRVLNDGDIVRVQLRPDTADNNVPRYRIAVLAEI